jgi:hypothetical protein
MSKVRLVILLVLVVPAVLLGLGFAAYQFISGAGDIELVAPSDADLTYVIDNAPPGQLAKGNHLKVPLKQGKHTLELESTYGKAHRVVDVKNGFVHLLVPADDGQCFVLLDVSRSNYQYGSKTPDKFPTIKARVKSSDIYDLPGSVYFTQAALPQSLKEGNACNLLQEVECEHLAKADAELFALMGY